MMDDYEGYVENVLARGVEALHKLTREEIVRGLAAYERPKYCKDDGTCFVNEVLAEVFPSARKMGSYGALLSHPWPHVMRDVTRQDCFALSTAFEMDALRETFKGECLRELAERGAAPEPTARAAEVAQC